MKYRYRINKYKDCCMLVCLLLLVVAVVKLSSTATYTNQEMGYQLRYPTDMQVDTSLHTVCTVFRNKECQMEVYYQPLSENDSYQSYVQYSNRGFLTNTAEHQNHWTEERMLNGRKVTINSWNRPKLKQVKNDFNYYYTVDIEKNETEVYSIFLKSKQDISADSKYSNILESFQIIPIQGEQKPVSFRETMEEERQRIQRLNSETRNLLEQYFGENAPLTWGIFEPTAPRDFSSLQKLEQQMGQRFRFLVCYHELFSRVSIETVIQKLERAYANDYIVELTLQTGDYGNGNAMYDILNGQYDQYFTRYAQAIADFEHPVLLRFGNEMNGDWCSYSAYYTGKDTEIYKQCYRYLHDIFAQNGANNVLWVWNPNERSFPDFSWNAMELYYPGNQYVDIIGLTGYNTGTYYEGETWRSFDQIYSPLYQKYQDMFSQPMMITEFACSSIGGDKADWITDLFQQIPKYPAIKVAIWWNGCDWAVPNEIPARPYWVNETAESLECFRAGWAEQSAQNW